MHKGPKISGGLAVFVRNELSHLVKLVNNNNENSIWIKIKKEESGEKEDIYIGTVYLSPSTLNDKRISLDLFFDEVNEFRTKGQIYIQGDLNAHTNILPDFMEKDKTDELFGIENWEKTLYRNSEDTKSTNERGLTLLEWCKAYDLLI